MNALIEVYGEFIAWCGHGPNPSAQGRDRWQSVVNAVMNLWVP